MKLSVLIVLQLLVLRFCAPTDNSSEFKPAQPAKDQIVTRQLPVPGKQDTAPPKVELTTTKFKVEGMDCKDCSKAIESKLIGTSGVSTVSADEKVGVVIVQYDAGRIKKTDIISAIDSLKFRASVME